jgi:CRISPR-associated protein Cas2
VTQGTRRAPDSRRATASSSDAHGPYASSRAPFSYDIADRRRLREVFKLLKGWGEHLQFSVFRCDHTAMMLAQLKGKLNEVIHAEKDQVLIIDVGLAEGRSVEVVESLGKVYVDEGRTPNVV